LWEVADQLTEDDSIKKSAGSMPAAAMKALQDFRKGKKSGKKDDKKDVRKTQKKMTKKTTRKMQKKTIRRKTRKTIRKKVKFLLNFYLTLKRKKLKFQRTN